mgnify:FL=1
MRLVIKIGTQVISDEDGLILSRVRKIASEVEELLKLGHEVILVSSGAVGSGMSKLPSLEIPSKKKVWAAIGQPIMINAYASEFERLDLNTGQVLILRDDFTNRESFTNMVSVIESLVASKVLPILNENDVMKTEDLTLGDNDILSAMAAVALSSDKLLILTTENGLYNKNPNKNPDAKLIEKVLDIDFEIERLCSKEKTDLGSGGMLSKVRAAKHATNSGVEVLFGNGTKEGIILSSIKKDFPGTRFPTRAKPGVNETRRWMMSAKGVGLVTIDDGAVKALESGKSLLLPGIVSVKGNFEKKEIIEIVSRWGQAVAYGKVNYSASEIGKALVAKKQSKEKGHKTLEREIVHRDYMIILSNS